MKNIELRTKPEPSHALGERIVARRKAKGWSQGELARQAGLRSDRLSRLERGSHQPRIHELVRLAAALGTSIDDLVLGSPVGRCAVLELEGTTTAEERALLKRLWSALVLSASPCSSGSRQGGRSRGEPPPALPPWTLRPKRHGPQGNRIVGTQS